MDSPSVVFRYGSVVHSLLPGERGILGRGAPDQPVDIRVSAALDVSRWVAIVSHTEAGRWTVDAVSAKNGVAVRHTGGSVIQIPALQRLEMPAWFDDTYLVITTPSAEHEVRVQVVEARVTPGEQVAAKYAEANTAVVLPKDPNRADFRTALCLCEPMLDDPFNRRVPSEGEIANRLNRLGLEESEITARTVERRLARLRERLSVASNVELRDRLVASCLVTFDALDAIRARTD